MKLVNVKDYGGLANAIKHGVVYIGRGSPFGNPYSHLPNSKAKFIVSSRDEAIAEYRKWLWGQIQARNREILFAFSKWNENTVLGCFCLPQACHGEVVIKAWNWWKERGGK